MNLTDLVNYFDPSAYPPDPQTGRSEVPYEDILNALADKFPQGYSWTVSDQGFKPDGMAYVSIELTVSGEGFVHTVPGSAENEAGRTEIGFAGLQLSALRNAVLRGLRMGEALYKNKSIARAAQASSQNRFGPPKAKVTYAKTSGPWDGSQKLKSGKYINQPYSAVADDDIEKWSGGSSPNVNAVKEKSRRINEGTWSLGPQSQNPPVNNPFAN